MEPTAGQHGSINYMLIAALIATAGLGTPRKSLPPDVLLRPKWRAAIEGGAFWPTAESSRAVFVTNGNVFCSIHRNSGKILWTSPPCNPEGTPERGDSTLQGDRLFYVPKTYGPGSAVRPQLVILSTETGALIRTLNFGGESIQGLLPYSSGLIVCTRRLTDHFPVKLYTVTSNGQAISGATLSRKDGRVGDLIPIGGTLFRLQTYQNHLVLHHIPLTVDPAPSPLTGVPGNLWKLSDSRIVSWSEGGLRGVGGIQAGGSSHPRQSLVLWAIDGDRSKPIWQQRGTRSEILAGASGFIAREGRLWANTSTGVVTLTAEGKVQKIPQMFDRILDGKNFIIGIRRPAPNKESLRLSVRRPFGRFKGVGKIDPTDDKGSSELFSGQNSVLLVTFAPALKDSKSIDTRLQLYPI